MSSVKNDSRRNKCLLYSDWTVLAWITIGICSVTTSPFKVRITVSSMTFFGCKENWCLGCQYSNMPSHRCIQWRGERWGWRGGVFFWRWTFKKKSVLEDNYKDVRWWRLRGGGQIKKLPRASIHIKELATGIHKHLHATVYFRDTFYNLKPLPINQPTNQSTTHLAKHTII